MSNDSKLKLESEKRKQIPGLPHHSEIITFSKQANLPTHERHLLHCLRAAMHKDNFLVIIIYSFKLTLMPNILADVVPAFCSVALPFHNWY